MAGHKRSRTRATQRPDPPERLPGFRPGRSGLCEGQLWEFSGPRHWLEPGEEIPTERVAAGSLDEALKFMRRRYPEFIIVKAVGLGVIAILSGSPLD